MKDMPRKYFDRRVVDRYVDKGAIKESDLASHLKGLPDENNNAQWVQLDMHDAELGDGMDSSEGADSASEEDR